MSGEIIGPGGLGVNAKVVELPDFGAAEDGPATPRVGRERIIPSNGPSTGLSTFAGAASPLLVFFSL